MPEIGQVDTYWGLRALEFVSAAEAARSPEDVLTLFSREIAQVGFHAHLMVVMDSREFTRRVIANGWNPEWSSLYTKENMAADDPVARHFLHTIHPFEWKDAPFDAEQEPKALEIMRRAVDFRMNSGFCVPVHCDSSVTAVSMAGENADLGHGVRNALHLISLFAHNRIRALLKSPPAYPCRILTEREREVLTWVSAGKTDWEISIILSISERTARAHVHNAARKLNAVNRNAAIVAALIAGEISLAR
jgi:LuxR family quorum sensing-dependent transcriptional regulator